MTEQALRARKRRPMFMVDIAVPRDIDADVAELEDVYLFTVDDLQSVVNENLEGRRQAAQEAGALIDAEVERFAHLLRTRDAAPAIRRLRADAEPSRASTLEQAERCSPHGRSQDEALRFLANTLTNRLIHAPSQRLRDAAETGDGEIIETIADIYRLDQPHDLMKESIRRHLERLLERFEEVGALLADPGVIGEAGPFRELSMEYSRLESVAQRFGSFSRARERELRPRTKWPPAPTSRCASWPRRKRANCASGSTRKASSSRTC